MFEQKRVLREAIESGLGTKGRLRIIRTLAEKPGEFFTKYSLEKETGLRSTELKADLSVLSKLGWIKEYAYAPVKYQINLDNDMAKALMDFFRRIGYI